MIGFAKGVLLCVASRSFAVTIAPQQQGEAIVSSHRVDTSSRARQTHSVVPPEPAFNCDPYLNKSNND